MNGFIFSVYSNNELKSKLTTLIVLFFYKELQSKTNIRFAAPNKLKYEDFDNL